MNRETKEDIWAPIFLITIVAVIFTIGFYSGVYKTESKHFEETKPCSLFKNADLEAVPMRCLKYFLKDKRTATWEIEYQVEPCHY